MAANLASTEGSIRLGEWLSEILGDDRKGGKTALRKFIYCSSTSCGSNKSAQFPLQLRVGDSATELLPSRNRYTLSQAVQQVESQIGTALASPEQGEAGGSHNIVQNATDVPDILSEPSNEQPAWLRLSPVANSEELLREIPADALDLPLPSPNLIPPAAAICAAVESTSASMQPGPTLASAALLITTDDDPRNVHAAIGMSTVVNQAACMTTTMQPTTSSQAGHSSQDMHGGHRSFSPPADLLGQPRIGPSQNYEAAAIDSLVSKAREATTVDALKAVTGIASQHVGSGLTNHKWTTKLLREQVGDAATEDGKKIRFSGDKKSKAYPRAKIPIAGHQAPDQSNSADSCQVLFTDLFALVVLHGGISKVHVDCPPPLYGSLQFVRACACLTDLHLLDVHEAIAQQCSIRDKLVRCIVTHCKSIYGLASLRTACDQAAPASDSSTVRLLQVLMEQQQALAIDEIREPRKRQRRSLSMD